jgi:hypothetical protein
MNFKTGRNLGSLRFPNERGKYLIGDGCWKHGVGEYGYGSGKSGSGNGIGWYPCKGKLDNTERRDSGIVNRLKRESAVNML